VLTQDKPSEHGNQNCSGDCANEVFATQKLGKHKLKIKVEDADHTAEEFQGVLRLRTRCCFSALMIAECWVPVTPNTIVSAICKRQEKFGNEIFRKKKK
jgi:hypothetical protein